MTTKLWQHVAVGDIIKIEEDQEIPSDIVIFQTSNIEQNCYVSTMNLDGETNLKVRKSAVSKSGTKTPIDVSGEFFWDKSIKTLVIVK